MAIFSMLEQIRLNIFNADGSLKDFNESRKLGDLIEAYSYIKAAEILSRQYYPFSYTTPYAEREEYIQFMKSNEYKDFETLKNLIISEVIKIRDCKV